MHNDWSRSFRKQQSIHKAGSDPSQIKLTSYFSVAKDIETLIIDNPNIAKCIDTRQAALKGTFTPLFQSLVDNAQLNIHKLPKERRHDHVMKKFSTSLFIYAGSLAYSFVHQNMPQALPSLRTVQRIVHHEYEVMNEGEFRFDQLANHINSYKCARVIVIGEDATRLVARVDYDPETNRLVGFVLPEGEDSLPSIDAHVAISFQSIEDSFKSSKISKYALVYIAQPLSPGVPAFPLACIGTDNKFTADILLKRWSHISSECQKRGISVLSFGSDGDSRELKNMQYCTALFTMHASKDVKSCIPSHWKSWFFLKKPTQVAYVQDTVHVGTKLRSRLLTPSIILALGKYVAGAHHLQLVQSTYSKDQHGLRERDIDCRDKQNFDSVLRITSSSVMAQISQIPDAKGTHVYLKALKAVLDCYLNKQLSPLDRISNIWYAVFFFRYWRQWLLSVPSYSLGNNFITRNSYLCIELNAHALILFMRTLRDHYSDGAALFSPWKLGSQSCEKTFRAVRSMTTTFSTVINVGMLGLLRRLHRLQIQFRLEAESAQNGIRYPHCEKHNNKDGSNTRVTFSLQGVTDANIEDAVECGGKLAMKDIEMLGMELSLERNMEVENESAGSIIPEAEDDKELDDEEPPRSDVNEAELLKEACCAVDEEEVMSSLDDLKSAKLVEGDLLKQLVQMQEAVSYKKVQSGTSLPIYTKNPVQSSKASKKCSRFVEVSHVGRTIYIHKTTAVWLFQEGERVSSDRLFRVREKQPYSSVTTNEIKVCDSNATVPTMCDVISIGDICAFKFPEPCKWKLGKVLQFCYTSEKTKMKRQYKKTSYNKNSEAKQTGVMCSWFNSSDSKMFELNVDRNTIENHSFLSTKSYLCTLSRGCFASLDGPEASSSKFFTLDEGKNRFNDSSHSNPYHRCY